MIVQPLIKGSLELIAGISRSPDVGLLLLAGFGGIYAEAFDDVLLWPIPVPLEHIIYKLEASTLGRIFRSSRWKDQQSCAAFVQTLNALQSFAMAMGNRLEAVDINPLILGSGRAVAVDALVVPAQT